MLSQLQICKAVSREHQVLFNISDKVSCALLCCQVRSVYCQQSEFYLFYFSTTYVQRESLSNSSLRRKLTCASESSPLVLRLTYSQWRRLAFFVCQQTNSNLMKFVAWLVIVVGGARVSADYASEHSEAYCVTEGNFFVGFSNVFLDRMRFAKCRLCCFDKVCCAKCEVRRAFGPRRQISLFGFSRNDQCNRLCNDDMSSAKSLQ